MQLVNRAAAPAAVLAAASVLCRAVEISRSVQNRAIKKPATITIVVVEQLERRASVELVSVPPRTQARFAQAGPVFFRRLLGRGF